MFTIIVLESKYSITEFSELLYLAQMLSNSSFRVLTFNHTGLNSPSSSSFEVIFNYGSVYIQTSAEKREFEFENIPNPAKVRDIISDLVTKVKGKINK